MASRSPAVRPRGLPDPRGVAPPSVVDLTGAFAGIEVEGETLMRRLTDLDLDELPAAGKVADVPAVVSRQGQRFRIFFPQEYGDSVVEAVRDIEKGLE